MGFLQAHLLVMEKHVVEDDNQQACVILTIMNIIFYLFSTLENIFVYAVMQIVCTISFTAQFTKLPVP